MSHMTLNTDGGSRGNPGIVGLGFVLTDETGCTVAEGGWFIPHATNNVAEYSALIWGLENALFAGAQSIDVLADSELMVKQINGAYKVKSADLKPLFMQVKLLLAKFSSVTVSHVYRDANKTADAWANAAMDERGPVGTFLVAREEHIPSLFDKHENTGEMNLSPLREGVAVERNENYTGYGQLSGDVFADAKGTYELTVKDHFDAAHTLPGYQGPCRFLHGHTWDVEVSVSGTKLDEVGILYDFKEIKQNLHALLENFDHRYINDVPPFDQINPTAEHMARVLYWELAKMLPDHISLVEIAVWESPNAKLVYRP